MKAILISYTLERTNINQRTSIHRILYGYEDHSNKSKYKYKRKGALSKHPNLKLNRGVIITADKGKREILQVLKKNKASVKTIPIRLDKNILR